jgi:hypothetical protein
MAFMKELLALSKVNGTSFLGTSTDSKTSFIFASTCSFVGNTASFSAEDG